MSLKSMLLFWKFIYNNLSFTSFLKVDILSAMTLLRIVFNFFE